MLTLNKYSHSITLLIYHIVLVTKYRRKTITEIEKQIVMNEARKIAGVVEIGFEEDHIHILIQASPTLAPMKIVKTIKVESSKKIAKVNERWQGWKRGYFMSTVNQPSLDVVINYIKNQGEEK